MRTLADIIEEHIRSLVERSGGAVVIQRAELAERFRCVPSQISYVIDTRFTPERGYIVESRRGGGGYIRIIRVASHGRTGALLDVLAEQIGDYIDQRRAENIIERLRDDGLINPREAALLRGAVRRESIPVQLPLRDALRAKIFYNMLAALLGFKSSGEAAAGAAASRSERPGGPDAGYADGQRAGKPSADRDAGPAEHRAERRRQAGQSRRGGEA